MISFLARFVGLVITDIERRRNDRMAAIEADIKALDRKTRDRFITVNETILEIGTAVATQHVRLGELYLNTDEVKQKEPEA